MHILTHRTSVVSRTKSKDVLHLLGVEIVRRGNRLWFRCPVHGDEHPSAVVVGERGWRCFACGAKGGVLHLLVAFRRAADTASAARWLELHLT